MRWPGGRRRTCRRGRRRRRTPPLASCPSPPRERDSKSRWDRFWKCWIGRGWGREPPIGPMPPRSRAEPPSRPCRMPTGGRPTLPRRRSGHSWPARRIPRPAPRERSSIFCPPQAPDPRPTCGAGRHSRCRSPRASPPLDPVGLQPDPRRAAASSKIAFCGKNPDQVARAIAAGCGGCADGGDVN